jgi:cyclin-dependent kinase regulatory subunit CKS1
MRHLTKPEYSDKYSDENYEYRHVILPKSISQQIKVNQLLEESEWRRLGITQSRGWVHYAFYK